MVPEAYVQGGDGGGGGEREIGLCAWSVLQGARRCSDAGKKQKQKQKKRELPLMVALKCNASREPSNLPAA